MLVVSQFWRVSEKAREIPLVADSMPCISSLFFPVLSADWGDQSHALIPAGLFMHVYCLCVEYTNVLWKSARRSLRAQVALA